MDEGYILSNKFRKIIFSSIHAGDSNIENIAKKHHIIVNVARKIIKDFEVQGVIEFKDNRYVLTSDGEKLAEVIKDS